MNEGLGERISLLRLSDAFRRRASFDQPLLVKNLVQETRHFAATLTYYRMDPEVPENRDVERWLSARMKMLASYADYLGATTVELPVSAENNSIVALIEKILPTVGQRVKFVFQQGEYDEDMADIGAVDPDIRNVLDAGYRGAAAISSAFLFRPENNL